jgi:PAS domain S-box-containing protein
MPWWMGQLLDGQPVVVPSVADLPDEAAVEKSIIEPQGICSILDVPIASKGKVVGFFGMSSTEINHAWKDDDVALLQMVGQVFINAMERKESEEALRESEGKFRALSEKSLVGIYLVQDGVFKYANPRLAEILGHDVEEVLSGFKPKDVIHPEDWSISEENIRKRVNGEISSINYALRIVRKDGVVRDVEAYGSATTYQGKPAIIGTLLDITERKQAEDALRESEEKYRNLMQNANDAIFIADGESGILIDANRKAEELIGLPRKNIIGMHQSQLHPETETERYRKMFRDNAKSDHIESESVYIQHRDGSKIPVEISAGVTEVGGKKLVQGIFRDISEREQAAESLRKSETKYSTLIESANDGVVIVQDMQFKFCNRAMSDITGYSLDELQGMNFLTPIDAEFRELVSERHRQRLAGENPPDQYSVRFVCKDGALKEIEASSIMRSRYEGRPAIMVTYRDITEQKRAQEEVSRLLNGNRRLSRQLMQSQEDERRYIARELHDELGQSLGAIDIASKLISRHSKEEGVVDKADEISQITSKLFKDIRSMLVTIRPPVLDSAGLSAALKNISAQWEISTDIACTLNILGSPDDFPEIVNIAIYRVLQECLTNISRHSEADQVDISLCRAAQKSESGHSEEVLQMDVRDNGKGMNLEEPEVMGLGMVGIRERISALQGSYVLNSSPGKGMHVSVVIPMTMDSCEE